MSNSSSAWCCSRDWFSGGLLRWRSTIQREWVIVHSVKQLHWNWNKQLKSGHSLSSSFPEKKLCYNPLKFVSYRFNIAWWLVTTTRATCAKNHDLAPVACFPTLGNDYVFPRFALVVYFPVLGTGYIISPPWHQLHIFPRLAPVPRFPALGTGYTVSHAWHRYMFSRAWNQLYVYSCHVFQDLVFPVLHFDIICLFFRALQRCHVFLRLAFFTSIFHGMSAFFKLRLLWMALVFRKTATRKSC